MTMTTAIQQGAAEDTEVLPEGVAANARELDDLRTAIKALKDREEILRAAVISFLEGAGVDAATDGVVSVSLSSHDRKSIDRAKMEALYPAVLAAVSTTSAVTQLRVKVKA